MSIAVCNKNSMLKDTKISFILPQPTLGIKIRETLVVGTVL